ncbi:amino acid ABC transporter permease [Methylobacterium terricola]|uniref:Putative glutamine transport system permease protein GlnP n=1 Tax=Methylobacterium terricola TaxID=2583531 RepID=A0A5C4LLC6_9HYPH|nr:amino acid ABC transporter permease [Methylobacterium terricola]TNC14475.1 amino acid ABC transporter permease [Methylobacterium terricola]
MFVNFWEDVVEYGPGFLAATVVVLGVTIASILVSWVCGLLGALGKQSRFAPIRGVASFYVWFIRGTPTLVQVFIVYFGMPQIGIKLSPVVAGIIALGVSSGAYVAETIRAGLSAIPKGQFESSLALGMTRQGMMIRIILPQVLRIILPSLTNEAISAVKNTSLLSTITVVELTLFAQLMIATTFRPFDFYIAAALIYLVITSVLSQLSAFFERRYARFS